MSRKGDETPPNSSEILRLGAAVVDLGTGRVRAADGSETTLRHQSVQVLRALAARRGEVAAKDEIFAEVWPGIAVTDDSLVQCVADIRRALGDEGRRWLQTVPKRGYRLASDGESTEPRPERRGRRLLAGAALAAVAVLGLSGWSMRSMPASETLPSVAVLPLADLSGDPRWERLGRGIAAEIGADLARSKGIVVIPAETVEGVPAGTSSGAEALGARFVIDGTLQADADELRVTARLIDSLGGAVVWSGRWTRPTDDLFAVQDEIVEQIGGSLDGTWTGALARAVREGAEGRPTSSLKAYELYLLGVDAKHEWTANGFDRAVGYLERALEIDPEFVQAIVAMAIVRIYQADFASDAEAQRLFEESFRLSEQAAALAPDDPNALIRMACTRLLQGRRGEAWAYAARAVELAPTNPDVLVTAAWNYMFADRGPGPHEWARRAVEMNPSHPDWYNAPLAGTALFAGDLELARRAGREAPPMAEVMVTVAAAEALSGNVEEARRWFDRVRAETRYRSLSALYRVEDMSLDPAWAPWVEAARRAGFPVTEAEASLLTP